MKKIIKKCVILAVAIIVVLALNCGAYQAVIAGQKTVGQESEDKFYHVPYNIDVCNFGSSHGAFGFDYRDAKGHTSFNFALTSQTLSYDDRILHQYEDHLADGGVMFIPVSYFSFGNNEEAQPDFESKNERYYEFLSPENIKQFSLKKYIDFRFIRKPAIFYAFFKIGDNDDENYTGSKGYDFKSAAEAAYKRHLQVHKDGTIIVRKQEVDALEDMISICHKHDIRPILITTPYRHEYNDLWSDAFYSSFRDEISRICQKDGVEYYDYSHDPRFVDSWEYFRDCDHLSQKGAVTFTDILMKEVVEKHSDEK